MVWETITRTVVCSRCGKRGEYVYEKPIGAYLTGGMNLKSLSAGFSVRRTEDAGTATVTCKKCKVIARG